MKTGIEREVSVRACLSRYIMNVGTDSRLSDQKVRACLTQRLIQICHPRAHWHTDRSIDLFDSFDLLYCIYFL